MNNSRQFVPMPNKSKRLRLAGVVVLIALIFAIPAALTVFRRGVSSVGLVVARGTNGVGGWFSSIGTTVRSKFALESENTSLKTQIEELQTRLAGQDVLVRENADIKQALGRNDTMHFTLATVIGKPPHSLYDTLIIDGGTDAGLSIGQMVYANGQTPIGSIEQVLPRSAVVRLYSAPGEKFEARLSPSNIDVTLVGRGGGNFSVTIAHDIAVAEGATVVTKELHPSIVALYNKITSDPRDPFQTLLLSAPINVNDLAFVEVRQ